MEDGEPPDKISCYRSTRIRSIRPKLSTGHHHEHVLTAAERSRRYRETLKKNPKKHNNFLQRDRERKRASWKNRTEEQKEKDRIKARERQQRFRDKRKSIGDIASTSKCTTKKVLTRSEREKKREYWRKKQSECRSRRTAQKHRRSKEKDKKYRVEKRQKCESEPKHRQKKGLPRDPYQFVSAVENIIDKATPRKRQLLKEKNLLMTPISKKKLIFFEKTSNVNINHNSETKKKIIKNLSFLKKYRLNRTLSKYLGVSDSYISKIGQSNATNMKKQRKDATSEADKKKVTDFFNRADISTNLPTAKRVKKDMEERRVLDRPLTDVFKEFKEQHPDFKASFSTFVRNKPRNVESTRRQPWYGCLCESCTNVDLKLKAISQVAAKHGSEIRIKDKYDAVSTTLCKKEEGATYHKLSCIQRRCHDCGCDNIVRYFQPLVEESENNVVSYIKWERVKKVYRGKDVTQIMPVPHRESVTALVTNLSMELETLAGHLFVASWQHNQFTKLQKDVPESWAVLNMDFAENYSCVSQHEVQSAHWSHNQVTIHPTVAYYRCIEEGCESIVTEHLIFVSDDLTHDAAAVQEFVKLANKHLTETRGLTITKEIQLTDGCAAQYKSRIPFADISFSQDDFGFPVERHFYGSRHGKGPSDGAGAVMKSSVKRAVNGGNVTVNTSRDFYNYAKDKMTKNDEHTHFKRTLFHVDHIEHNRPDRSEHCKTLKGTRSVQAVKAVDSFLINTRNLSCFCEACIGDGSDCKNRDYVDEWKLHDIHKEDRCTRRVNARAAPHRRGRRGVQGRQRIGNEQGAEFRPGQHTDDIAIGQEANEVDGQGQEADEVGRERGERGRKRGRGERGRGPERGEKGRGLGRGERSRGLGRGEIEREQVRGGGLRIRGGIRGGGLRFRGSGKSGSLRIRGGGTRVTGNKGQKRGGLRTRERVETDSTSSDSNISFSEYSSSDAETQSAEEEDTHVCAQTASNDQTITVGQKEYIPHEEESKSLSDEYPCEEVIIQADETGAVAPIDVPLTVEDKSSPDEVATVHTVTVDQIGDIPFTDCTDDYVHNIDISYLMEFLNADISTPPDGAMGSADHASDPSDEANKSCRVDEPELVTVDHVNTDGAMDRTDHAIDPWDEALGMSRADERELVSTVDHASTDGTLDRTDHDNDPSDEAIVMSMADEPELVTADHASALPDEAMGISDLLKEAVSISNTDEAKLVYAVGQFVLASHGKQNLPAVVIQTPDGMESRPEMGVWVQYFQKAGRDRWRLEDKPFFLDTVNLVKRLDDPLITASGARLYYKF